MEDGSFLYFTQDEVISKMNIDPRLVDSFKRVMKTMQEYFNANGYTDKRDYKEYIEKYFINSSEGNMKIYVDKIDNLTSGFYNKYKNVICIKEDLLNGKEEWLDHTLCHEFIHFLVKHSLTKENSDPDIFNGGFINEALTEMLTMQMYSQDGSYKPQVEMQKYANLLSGKVNNYNMFLDGRIDARYRSNAWENYRMYANKFQKEFSEKGSISFIEAQSNENYIKAQRELMSLFMNKYKVESINQWCDYINKILQMPVKDYEFTNNFVNEMANSLIRNMNVQDEKLIKMLKEKLNAINNLIIDSKEYDSKSVYEFEFDGRKIAFDSDLKYYGDIYSITTGYNPQTKTITIQKGNQKLQFDYSKIDFDAREKKIQEKIKEISSIFTKNFNKDTEEIMSALNYPGELLKVEEFILPEINYDSKRKDSGKIYVATFTDKVILLDNNRQIKNISNFDLNEFTGWDPEYHGVWGTKLGKVENGSLYTTLKDKQINNKSISQLFQKDFERNLNREELEIEINNIKANDKNNELAQEEIEEKAFYSLLKKKYDALSNEEKEKYNKTIIDMSDKFVVYKNNNELEVGLYKEWSNSISVFKAKKRVLYAAKEKGIYNDFYDTLNEIVKEEQIKNTSIQNNNTLNSPHHEETSEIKDFYELFDMIYRENLKELYKEQNNFDNMDFEEQEIFEERLENSMKELEEKIKEDNKELKDKLWIKFQELKKNNSNIDINEFLEIEIDNELFENDEYQEEPDKIDEVESPEGFGRGIR